MVFRRFCLNQSKYDSYEEAFRTSFFKSDGYAPPSGFTSSLKTIAEFLNWPKDKSSTACDAACAFFFTLLNDRSDSLTAEEVSAAEAVVAPHISFISKRTREKNSEPALKLVKAFFLYCSCDELHVHQTTLLKNGVFLVPPAPRAVHECRGGSEGEQGRGDGDGGGLGRGSAHDDANLPHAVGEHPGRGRRRWRGCRT